MRSPKALMCDFNLRLIKLNSFFLKPFELVVSDLQTFWSAPSASIPILVGGTCFLYINGVGQRKVHTHTHTHTQRSHITRGFCVLSTRPRHWLVFLSYHITPVYRQGIQTTRHLTLLTSGAKPKPWLRTWDFSNFSWSWRHSYFFFFEGWLT